MLDRSHSWKHRALMHNFLQRVQDSNPPWRTASSSFQFDHIFADSLLSLLSLPHNLVVEFTKCESFLDHLRYYIACTVLLFAPSVYHSILFSRLVPFHPHFRKLTLYFWENRLFLLLLNWARSSCSYCLDSGSSCKSKKSHRNPTKLNKKKI